MHENPTLKGWFFCGYFGGRTKKYPSFPLLPAQGGKSIESAETKFHRTSNANSVTPGSSWDWDKSDPVDWRCLVQLVPHLVPCTCVKVGLEMEELQHLSFSLPFSLPPSTCTASAVPFNFIPLNFLLEPNKIQFEVGERGGSSSIQYHWDFGFVKTFGQVDVSRSLPVDHDQTHDPSNSVTLLTSALFTRHLILSHWPWIGITLSQASNKTKWLDLSAQADCRSHHQQILH